MENGSTSSFQTSTPELNEVDQITSIPMDSSIHTPELWRGLRIAPEICPVCEAHLDVASDRCYTCDSVIGAPNVREATTYAERITLSKRHERATARAQERGLNSTLRNFERAVESSGLVINCTLWFLREFVCQANVLYANYHQTVNAGVRKVTSAANDQRRSVVDAVLFRSYASKIAFGALSLTDRGVVSYGPYSMRLRNVTISHRTSLLEENSFDFVARHALTETTPIPLGYRTDWSNRSQLAASKVEPYLHADIEEGDFERLLLSSGGNYVTDQFIEAHIYGSFDFGAVDSISGPYPDLPLDQAIWNIVKKDADAAGKRIDEWRH